MRLINIVFFFSKQNLFEQLCISTFKLLENRSLQNLRDEINET